MRVTRRRRSAAALYTPSPRSRNTTSRSSRARKKLLPGPAPRAASAGRSRPKARPSEPITRSIGVPSCVPLVKYTPRIGGVRCTAPPAANTAPTNSRNGRRSAASSCGKPKMAARRAPSRSTCRRSIRPSPRRCSSPPKPWSNSVSTAGSSPSRWSRVKPQTCSRWSLGRSPKVSLKPATRSILVTSTYTGARTPSLVCSSCRRSRRLRASSARSAGLCCTRSKALTVSITPLMGWRGRVFFSRARKASQAPASVAASESCVL